MLTPVFESEAITLYNGDAFTILPLLHKCDAIVTDPPYLISRESNFSNGNPTGRDVDRFRISIDFGDWDKDVSWDAIIPLLAASVRRGGAVVSFCDLWKLSHIKEACDAVKAVKLRFFEWVKTNPVPINSKVTYLSNAREVGVCFYTKGKSTYNGEYHNGIFRYPIVHGNDRWHATQKPVGLMQDLIQLHTNKGDTVIDPFAGSITTGIACMYSGRKCILIERDSTYCERIVERISKISQKQT